MLVRDFSTGEWIPSAMYCVDYSDMKQIEDVPTPDEDESTPNEDESSIDSGEATTPESEPNSETVTTGESNTETKPNTSNTDSGCKSVAGFVPMGIMAITAMAILAVKKKKDD